MKFHGGELEVQTRAGVRQIADDVGEGIDDRFPETARNFLALRRMVVIGSVDSRGRVWASVVAGEPGFIAVMDSRTLRIDAPPHRIDPILRNLETEGHVGLLFPDFTSSRRIRVNGRGSIGDGSIVVRADQVYGNCRRYIQERLIVGARPEAELPPYNATRGSQLSARDREQIANADTFFIATDHPEAGADISHKGGKPGFARVIDGNHLAFPDYNGNSMFNTLGNLTVNPKAGLLFIDFDNGRTLQMTGRASIDWNPDRIREFAGAERVVDFEMDEAIANDGGFPLIAKFRQYSRFNP